ncbi:hypothetical protein Forpe1208_v011072 [Fusarium oxysporum f. sp. rapae]|uniref:Uncharacterized protein n=1 Tax=Fusarium oxysporum f. sp. rapae TaxID=485398 RepID=A0A8J5U4S3_FUSOX|nr:hypothetical protein Forpe1208_v011072 [Fusarium oxysporum f. sp. rapae]
MKIVVAGSTGFLGKEIVRQALLNPQIASVVAFGRGDHDPPEYLQKPEIEDKFTSVSCSDFKNYPQYVKDEISGADGQIEKQNLERAHLSDCRMQVLVTKTGAIKDPDMGILKHSLRWLSHVMVSIPSIGRAEVTAGMLDQAITGFGKDTLSNAEMTEIGKKALEKNSIVNGKEH